MPAAYTSMPSVQVLDFEVICLLIRHGSLLCGSCSSGQRFAFGSLKTSPHEKALSVQLTVPPVGSVEDLHLRVDAPCRAHKKKAPDGSTIRGLVAFGGGGGTAFPLLSEWAGLCLHPSIWDAGRLIRLIQRILVPAH